MLIFLIGYMGSGKTTMGRKLAEELGYAFIDMDDIFVEKHRITIHDFFLENVETAFREAEHDILNSLLSEKDTVVATGGGTPCFFNNMELMNQAGLTVYLQVTADELYIRLKDDATLRPVVSKTNIENLEEFIRRHLEEREKFYLRARYILHPTSLIPVISALRPKP